MSGLDDFVMISGDEIPPPPFEETSGQLEYQSGASLSMMSTEGFISHAITSGEQRQWQAEMAMPRNPDPGPSSSRTPMHARFPDLEAESVEVSADFLIQHLARSIPIDLHGVDGEPQSISGIGEINRSDASMLSATADNNSLPIQFPNSTEVRREQRNGLGVHSQEFCLQTDYRGNHDENS